MICVQTHEWRYMWTTSHSHKPLPQATPTRSTYSLSAEGWHRAFDGGGTGDDGFVRGGGGGEADGSEGDDCSPERIVTHTHTSTHTYISA